MDNIMKSSSSSYSSSSSLAFLCSTYSSCLCSAVVARGIPWPYWERLILQVFSIQVASSRLFMSEYVLVCKTGDMPSKGTVSVNVMERQCKDKLIHRGDAAVRNRQKCSHSLSQSQPDLTNSGIQTGSS